MLCRWILILDLGQADALRGFAYWTGSAQLLLAQHCWTIIVSHWAIIVLLVLARDGMA